MFLLGAIFGSCSAMRYYGGVPEHVKQTQRGSVHVKGQPPGLVHNKVMMFTGGVVGLLGVATMVGSLFSKKK